MRNLETPYSFFRTLDGLSLRYGHWPCSGNAPKGTILVLQGRSECMEKYEETIADLQGRGLDVFSFDWRGQGLSDRMLPEPEKGFVRHYDDYLNDLELFLETIVRQGKRGALYLLSHSMGGHIGLRYLFRDSQTFSKAVFCSPMLDIVTRPFPSFSARWLSRMQVTLGNAHKVVIGDSRRTPFPEEFRNNSWTSDRGRFERNRERIEKRPELSAARVTYGWVAATYDSINTLKRVVKVRPLNTPLLFAVAEKDRIVSQKAIRRFVADSGNCHLVEIKDARHEILQEADRQRGIFSQAFDEFMGL